MPRIRHSSSRPWASWPKPTGRADVMQSSTQHRIRLGGLVIDYRLVRSKAARKLRVRVGPNGVEVVQPSTRDGEEAAGFLAANRTWLLDQLQRAERLRGVYPKTRRRAGEILFRGEPTPVRIDTTESAA